MDPDTNYLFYVSGVAITQITLAQGPEARLRDSDELGGRYLTADHRTLMYTELSATIVHGSAPCTVERHEQRDQGEARRLMLPRELRGAVE